MLPLWAHYVIFYTTTTVILAGFIILLVTFPHRMMQALKGEPPRRRPTDLNPETNE